MKQMKQMKQMKRVKQLKQMRKKDKDVNPNIIRDRVGESADLSVCPICQKHKDCWANIDGKCTALKRYDEATNDDVANEEAIHDDASSCPFYKNAEINMAECKRSYQRLKDMRRSDLISKYIKSLSAMGVLDDEIEEAEKCNEEFNLFRESNYREQLDKAMHELDVDADSGLDADLIDGEDEADDIDNTDDAETADDMGDTDGAVDVDAADADGSAEEDTYATNT